MVCGPEDIPSSLIIKYPTLLLLCCSPCNNSNDHSGLSIMFPSLVLQKMIGIHHKSFHQQNWRPLFTVYCSCPLPNNKWRLQDRSLPNELQICEYFSLFRTETEANWKGNQWFLRTYCL